MEDIWLRIISFVGENDVRNLNMTCWKHYQMITKNKQTIYANWIRKTTICNTPKTLYLLHKSITTSHFLWNKKYLKMAIDGLLDSNARDIKGETALMYSLYCKGEPFIVKEKQQIILRLLDMNPNLNIQNNKGETALMIAINNKAGIINEKIILRLLDMNSNLNIQNNNGETTLMIAIYNKAGIITEKIMTLILNTSQNFDIQENYQKMTALMIAFDKKSTLMNENLLLLLLENTRNINIQDKGGMTAVMYAFYNETYDVLMKLCTMNLNMNLRDNFGWCIADHAIMKCNNEKLILRIFDFHPDLNYPDEEGVTLLTRTIENFPTSDRILSKILN